MDREYGEKNLKLRKKTEREASRSRCACRRRPRSQGVIRRGTRCIWTMFVPFGSRSLTTLLGAIYLLSLLCSRPSHRSNFLDSLPRFSPVGHFPLFIFPPCHHLVSRRRFRRLSRVSLPLGSVFSSENARILGTSRCVYDRHSTVRIARNVRCAAGEPPPHRMSRGNLNLLRSPIRKVYLSSSWSSSPPPPSSSSSSSSSRSRCSTAAPS